MAKTSFGISVVLPGYNEEANIEEAVRECEAKLRALTDRHEILIVNDGSTDGTAAIADRLARESTTIRVIHNPINVGVGIGLQIGLRAAQNDLVLHDAMDLPFDLGDLERIVPLFPEWDVVIVVRTDRSAHSPYRKLTSLVHFWLLCLLFGRSFRDMNFVQVYKREVVRGITVKARSPAFVTPELLMKARNRGFKMTEVRATFHPRRRGEPNYGKPRDILWTLADMLSFWIEGDRPAAPCPQPPPVAEKAPVADEAEP